jgi:hypothetical protein
VTAKPIVVMLLLVLARPSDAHAGERRAERERLHLAPRELIGLLAAPSVAAQPRAVTTLAILDDLATSGIGVPPFFTLLAPPSAARPHSGENAAPLFAIGARVQGRTLVAFTRPGAKVDPDDRVVYQRLVASDLFQGRRFSVTVYEDHVLGTNAPQVLGFGARLRLRPALEFHGWRTLVEFFASYDVTQGATGYIGFISRPPSAPLPARAP